MCECVHEIRVTRESRAGNVRATKMCGMNENSKILLLSSRCFWLKIWINIWNLVITLIALREKELKKFDDCVYIIMLFEFLSCNYWNDRDRRSRGKIILKFQIKTCSCHIVDAEDIETRFIWIYIYICMCVSQWIYNFSKCIQLTGQYMHI